MKRTQVQLDDVTYERVRRRAFEARRSISAVIRETLAAALDPDRPKITRPADLTFVGAGRSRQRPQRPVSEYHDAALAEAWLPRTRPSRRRR